MSSKESEVTEQKSSKGFLELVKVEGKLALREPTGVAFGIGFPLILLVIFGSIPAFGKPLAGTSLTVFQIYIPILMVTTLIMIGMLGLPIPLVRDREIGWLRRVSTTPMAPSRLLAAQVTIYLIVAAIAFTILGVGSVSAFRVKFAFEIPGFILSLVLATAAMFSLGLLIAAVAPSQGAATGMEMGLLYPLLFFAGIYVPMQVLPKSFQTLSGLTPVGAAVNALNSSLTGSFPSIESLLVMAAYTAVFSYLAVRYFRWE